MYNHWGPKHLAIECKYEPYADSDLFLLLVRLASEGVVTVATAKLEEELLLAVQWNFGWSVFNLTGKLVGCRLLWVKFNFCQGLHRFSSQGCNSWWMLKLIACWNEIKKKYGFCNYQHPGYFGCCCTLGLGINITEWEHRSLVWIWLSISEFCTLAWMIITLFISIQH